jgi:phosphatidylserine decarboxylase
VVLEANGPRIVRISVHEAHLTGNKLVCYCELDLSDIFDSETDHSNEVHNLIDPNSNSKVVGKITLSYSAEDRTVTEMKFARRLLSMMDHNESGELSFKSFCDLIKAFGNTLPVSKLQEIFNEADTNKDGKVNTDELAALIANSEVRYSFAHCPPTQQYLLHFYCRDSGFMI